MSSTLASNTLTSVPATSALSSQVLPLAEVLQITQTGGTLTSFSPYAAVYAALGSDNLIHVYVEDLTNPPTVSTPRQISSLGITPTANSASADCFWNGYTNAFSASTSIFIIEVPQVSACGGGGNPFYLIHIGDSPTTAPIQIDTHGIGTTKIAELFTGAGVMDGLVLVNTSGNLTYYPAAGVNAGTFAGGITIASAITPQGNLNIYTDRSGKVLSGGTIVFSSVSDGTNQKLFRIKNLGVFEQVYQTTGTIDQGGVSGGTAYDNTNIYFSDTNTTATSIKFVKILIAGTSTTSTTLATVTPAAGDNYTIVDSDGTVLILDLENPAVNPQVHQIKTVSVASGGTPQVLANASFPTASSLSSFLDYASDHLFVTAASSVGPSSSAVYTPAANGQVAGQGGASTAFALVGAPFHGGSFGGVQSVIEFTGLTDFTDGGAAVFTMNPSSFATTRVTQSGSPYSVPATTDILFGPQSPTIAFGISFGLTGTSGALALDLSTAHLITITKANTSVQPF